jgi:HAE1 family hydrophobic/amphiphilic exporter-1
MQFALLLAVFLVYLVMASQFESLVQPFVIMFAIPFAAIGVALALYLTNLVLNVVVLIGAVVLAGIVVNNSIVLIDYTNQLRRTGASVGEALRNACAVRLRPILMTTTTTVLGLLPMAWDWGEGAELRVPLAVTIIGGLLTSTLLTLVIVPVLYSVVTREKSHDDQ